ncbi:MAG: hypothetical protein AB1767_05995 [Bacillota bacterium]
MSEPSKISDHLRSVFCVLNSIHPADASDYRPGARALQELGVRSPLREAGLTKQEIRTHEPGAIL